MFVAANGRANNAALEAWGDKDARSSSDSGLTAAARDSGDGKVEVAVEGPLTEAERKKKAVEKLREELRHIETAEGKLVEEAKIVEVCVCVCVCV
jgi:acylphosphatase